MRTGDTFEITIERMSFGPAGIGRLSLEGSDRPVVVFIPQTVPGDRVRAKVTKQYKNYWEAELLETIKSSSNRVEPKCKVFDRCGGCQWQQMDYDTQLKSKAGILLFQLKKAAGLSEAELERMLQVHGAPNPYQYRARIQVHGDEKGIGFFATGSHEIVHADRCEIAHPAIQKKWDKFLTSGRAAELAKETPAYKIEWTAEEDGSVQEAVNRKHAALGFTQVNPEQNRKLREIVASLASQASSKELLLDLYGGDGNLSLELNAGNAGPAGPAAAFENSRFAHTVVVDTFNQGVAATSVKAPLPARVFIKQPVDSFLMDMRWLDWDFKRPDCVISDPPRDGMGPKTTDFLMRSATPELILVSCDPTTLSRDLEKLLSRYSIAAIHLVDMFPQTFHIEAVVHLKMR